ncbi:hypothetical protein K0H59_04285 [Shewanella sp. FJAT-51649]|uniref:hypothetical protein n=1 Tax=Shewanella sp. FJAT-51649 TaxID=2864210 RepID=UPI001C65CD66|nr:hypothetical protein [Shewanella sp. FJAT-51649]QYJ72283.1 hypothetical protein K0H59_04285 [Shewanella sp. FJAT-51649]
MLLGLFMLSAILIKTSLLGLGWISIGIGLGGYLFCRYYRLNLAARLVQKFKRLFITGAILHLLLYLGLIVKLFLIDSIEDIPTFFISHLVFHHALCALIAAALTFMAVGVYLTQQKLKQAQLTPPLQLN